MNLRRVLACARGGPAVATAALLAACAAGPDFVRPAAPDAERYTREAPLTATAAASGVAQRFASGAPVPADWWRLFGSPALDAAVQQALARSPTLQAAQASLRQSQDLLRAGDGVFYPQVDASGGAARARSAPQQQGSAVQGTVYNLVTASGSIGYVLDVFGGERRAVEGLGAQVDVQRYAVKAAYVSLSANVVNACIARAAYAAQSVATGQLIALETLQLHGIEAQVLAGTAPYANVLAQRSLIAANQALLAPLQQKISQAEHLLALLQGTLPADAVPPDVVLDSLGLPQDLPVSLPSDLVRQRPDILAAEAQLHAASAEIGVATAALFPSFSLNASFGNAGNSLGNLTAAGSRFWNIGPSFTAPLFRGGTLRAQRQAAIDAFDAQQAGYRQTVLTAFGQVADALKALEHDAQALQAQLAAQAAAEETLVLVQAGYRAGMVAYLDVMTADVQLLQARIGTVQAVALRHQDTVALFVALGGGWWNSAAEAPVAAASRGAAP